MADDAATVEQLAVDAADLRAEHAALEAEVLRLRLPLAEQGGDLTVKSVYDQDPTFAAWLPIGPPGRAQHPADASEH